MGQSTSLLDRSRDHAQPRYQPITPAHDRRHAHAQTVPKTQAGYLRAVEQFSSFLERSPDTSTVEDLRRYQLHLADHLPRPWGSLMAIQLNRMLCRSSPCLSFQNIPPTCLSDVTHWVGHHSNFRTQITYLYATRRNAHLIAAP